MKSNSNEHIDHEPTLFFYDLETSGFHPRNDRIMQFAGQRTTLDLEPIGEPVDCLIKLTSDTLPDPDAILVTGITPQRTQQEGYSEREFADIFVNQIATPGTVFLGYNSIRFDDEFMRAFLYRNLYDPYEWQWQDGRGKWDLLDVVRMTRALRPEGINWPIQENGAKANRLELLTSSNGIDHLHAHNALSDVTAAIEIARLIRTKQPKLYQYLFEIRDKKRVIQLIESSAMLVYTSGSFSQDFEKTSIVCALPSNDPSKVPIYDLRIDPEAWLKDPASPLRAVKYLKYNHCPALAPMGVLDEASWSAIQLDEHTVRQNYDKLQQLKNEVLERFMSSEEPRPQAESPSLLNVDKLVYDGFFDAKDKKLLARIREMSEADMIDFQPEFDDPRLPFLYFLYRARQMSKSLLAEDRAVYEAYITEKLTSGGEQSLFARYMIRLNELAKEEYLDADKRYVLEELALYGESIVPYQD